MTPNRSETDNEGNTKYFYSAEEIRKWLEKAPSEAMLDAGQLPSTAGKTWAFMIAAKLEELK
jgi:hypothetical protein